MEASTGEGSCDLTDEDNTDSDVEWDQNDSEECKKGILLKN